MGKKAQKPGAPPATRGVMVPRAVKPMKAAPQKPGFMAQPVDAALVAAQQKLVSDRQARRANTPRAPMGPGRVHGQMQLVNGLPPVQFYTQRTGVRRRELSMATTPTAFPVFSGRGTSRVRLDLSVPVIVDRSSVRTSEGVESVSYPTLFALWPNTYLTDPDRVEWPEDWAVLDPFYPGPAWPGCADKSPASVLKVMPSACPGRRVSYQLAQIIQKVADASSGALIHPVKIDSVSGNNVTFLINDEALVPILAEVDSLMGSPDALMEELSMSHPKDIGLLPIGIAHASKEDVRRPCMMATHSSLPGTFTGIPHKPLVSNKLAAIAYTCAASLWGYLQGIQAQLTANPQGKVSKRVRVDGRFQRRHEWIEDVLERFAFTTQELIDAGITAGTAADARLTFALFARHHLAPSITDIVLRLMRTQASGDACRAFLYYLLVWYLLTRYLRLAADTKEFKGLMGTVSWTYSVKGGLTAAQQALVQHAFNVCEKLSPAPRHDLAPEQYEQCVTGKEKVFFTFTSSDCLNSEAILQFRVCRTDYPFQKEKMNKWFIIVPNSKPIVILKTPINLYRQLPDMPDLEKEQADWVLVYVEAAYKESDLPPIHADSRVIQQTLVRMTNSIMVEMAGFDPSYEFADPWVLWLMMFHTMLYFGQPLFGGDSVLRNCRFPVVDHGYGVLVEPTSEALKQTNDERDALIAAGDVLSPPIGAPGVKAVPTPDQWERSEAGDVQ